MKRPGAMWIHPATYTYRPDQPETDLETLWVERSGWGYLFRRDLWLKVDTSEEELIKEGYEALRPPTDSEVSTCPYCHMHICGIPGYLKERHFSECGGSGEDHLAMEDSMISGLRREIYERTILERKRREQEELEEMERKERFDRIKDEAQARQLSKDRKKRLKDETRDLLKKKI